ncbi:DUF7146 domain-containing protein [Palleronia aestuarii]|nr:CHC2 zinc finger domain-containing protein [Palleronia aestuarii]
MEARSIPIGEIAERLGLLATLKRAGREWTGPCPSCGGTDRFSINTDRDVYNCRSCQGGDGIGLVELALGCDFPAALAWLVGDRDVRLSPQELARREGEIARQREARERRAEDERRKSIAAARAIWAEGKPIAGTAVEVYLSGRGLGPDILTPPEVLRYHEALPYMDRQAGEWVEIHRGPAMLGLIAAPNGELIGVHRTWLDPAEKDGKAYIHVRGTARPAKKVLGSKKGAAIRLSGQACAPGTFDTLVMAEGIETTLSAMVADPVPGAAYWAGVDLGNMAGRRHLRGEGMKFAGMPDLDDDEAFVPPPWLRRLIFVQDGDSDPRATRAKLQSGLRRAKHHNPGLAIQIVHAGEGVDLNDVLMGKEGKPC